MRQQVTSLESDFPVARRFEREKGAFMPAWILICLIISPSLVFAQMSVEEATTRMKARQNQRVPATLPAGPDASHPSGDNNSEKNGIARLPLCAERILSLVTQKAEVEDAIAKLESEASAMSNAANANRQEANKIGLRASQYNDRAHLDLIRESSQQARDKAYTYQDRANALEASLEARRKEAERLDSEIVVAKKSAAQQLLKLGENEIKAIGERAKPLEDRLAEAKSNLKEINDRIVELTKKQRNTRENLYSQINSLESDKRERERNVARLEAKVTALGIFLPTAHPPGSEIVSKLSNPATLPISAEDGQSKAQNDSILNRAYTDTLLVIRNNGVDPPQPDYRGFRPEEPRLVASNSGKKFEVYERGAVRLARALWGKPDVFCAHPYSPKIPAYVDFSKITKTASGVLIIYLHNFPTGDCEAVVRVDGKDITKIAVAGDSWKTARVPFDKNGVGVEVRATGWWNEHAFITYEIEQSQGPGPSPVPDEIDAGNVKAKAGLTHAPQPEPTKQEKEELEVFRDRMLKNIAVERQDAEVAMRAIPDGSDERRKAADSIRSLNAERDEYRQMTYDELTIRLVYLWAATQSTYKQFSDDGEAKLKAAKDYARAGDQAKQSRMAEAAEMSLKAAKHYSDESGACLQFIRKINGNLVHAAAQEILQHRNLYDEGMREYLNKL